jgi:hypothetical protein
MQGLKMGGIRFRGREGECVTFLEGGEMGNFYIIEGSTAVRSLSEIHSASVREQQCSPESIESLLRTMEAFSLDRLHTKKTEKERQVADGRGWE